eukprot:1139984-Pelagomonas_calceolata.AAC.4
MRKSTHLSYGPLCHVTHCPTRQAAPVGDGVSHAQSEHAHEIRQDQSARNGESCAQPEDDKCATCLNPTSVGLRELRKVRCHRVCCRCVAACGRDKNAPCASQSCVPGSSDLHKLCFPKSRKAEVADLTGKEVDVPGAVFHDFTPGLFHSTVLDPHTDYVVPNLGKCRAAHSPSPDDACCRAYIMGPDSGHASAVVLRMVNNPRVSLPVSSYLTCCCAHFDEREEKRGSILFLSLAACTYRYYFHASEVRGWLRMMELRALAEDDSGMDDQDTLDDTLAAKVLAHMSAGGSSAPPSPSSSINTLQPAARSPLVRSKAQPEQQATLPAANAGCASVPPSTPRRVLLWGPTELIAQRPSLLPTSLAEQLARITSQHSNSAEATAALEAAAAHVEGHM